jgi:hypothetical protein
MADARELQFERAEFEQGITASTCAACATPLYSSYFTINGAMACEACRYKAETVDTGSSIGRFTRASAGGLAAAVAGSLLYYAISALTGYEFGLIAIVVGFAVGSAVKWGARGRGGWRYQTLAMALTYLSIVMTYIPPIIRGLREGAAKTETSAPAVAGDARPVDAAATDATRVTLAQFLFALAMLTAFACAAPFLAGLQNVMGIVIIGIGLYEAWKINRRVTLTISGPHTIAAAAPAAAG